MQTKTSERYFFFGLLIATLAFTFLIFRPFWIVLVLGVCFAIVLHPIYRWLNIKLPEWLASLITVILFTIIICGPLLLIGTLVYNQSEDVYHLVVNNKDTGPFIKSLGVTISKHLPVGVTFDINDKATELISYVSSNIANIFKSTLSAFFSFILMLLIIFYFLKDGSRWKESLRALSPLGDKYNEKITSHLVIAVNAVVKGYLLIALVQGMLMGFGLWLFNVPNPALWGVVAAIMSLIPTLGTALVSVPAIIFLMITGNTPAAIGLLCWSIVIVGMIDNVLSPLVVGKQTNIHPFLILFSVLGGIAFLGPIGVLVGPLAVSLLYTLISIYRNEFNEQRV
ncbi:MAG: AI-2E family transporter [Patescibacteria group bacterium]